MKALSLTSLPEKQIFLFSQPGLILFLAQRTSCSLLSTPWLTLCVELIGLRRLILGGQGDLKIHVLQLKLTELNLIKSLIWTGKRIRTRLASFWVLTLKHLLQDKKFRYLFLIMFSWVTELVPLWLSQVKMNEIGNLPKFSA